MIGAFHCVIRWNSSGNPDTPEEREFACREVKLEYGILRLWEASQVPTVHRPHVEVEAQDVIRWVMH